MTARLFRAAAVAIVRNEARHVAEWIEYHALLGIEHAFIFDNNSDDDLAGVLRPYLVQGRATLLHWPGYPGQMSAYNFAIRMFGHQCDWMTLLDMDEFIRPPEGRGDLPAMWDAFDCDQVLMPWLIFGAGGHDERPQGLVTESYFYRLAEPARAVKCAVRPEAVVSAEVHHCVTRAGRTVDGLGRRVPEAWQIDAPSDKGICVHHYITKSRADWIEKVSRGQADGTIWRKEEEFLSYQGDKLDPEIATMAPRLRARIGETAEIGEGHVSHNRSALSEWTPSRRFTLWSIRRLRQLMERDPGRWQLGMEIDRASIVGADGESGWLGDLVGDLKATPLAVSTIGRPLAIYRINDPNGGEVELSVEGRDAAGRTYRHDRMFGVAPGTTIGAAILAPRTMTVDRFSWRWTDDRDPAGGTFEPFSFL